MGNYATITREEFHNACNAVGFDLLHSELNLCWDYGDDEFKMRFHYLDGVRASLEALEKKLFGEGME